jgi:teichuronic acid biosynthesis glycosyltransferase TuaG
MFTREAGGGAAGDGGAESPVVSIITPMYNAERWISQVIGVSKAQTFRQFEHLLVDDASTDASAARARQGIDGDPRFRVIELRSNAGPSAARNAALSAARGRFIAFLDADDVWLPQKLERQLAWMHETGHALTFHDYRFMSHDGSKVGKLVCAPEIMDTRTLHTRRGFGCLTVMLDRAQLGEISFPDGARSLPEDFLCWASILKRGHVGHRLAEDLGRYRVLPVSRSSNKADAAKAVWHVYRDVEGLPLMRAASWWLQYAWNAYRLHRQSAPK